MPILAAATLAAAGGAQCDTRTPIVHPEILSAPWNKICYVSSGAGRGTGHLVTPYLILTNGHMVYDKDTDSFYSRSGTQVSPAQYVSGGSVVRPWGTRTAARLATNTRYTGASASDAYMYDYAAIFIDTPFSGLTIFMPLQFDYLPSSVNMSGYPATSPSGASTNYQFWEADSVFDDSDRNIWYWIRSVGGASGSPVWKTISSERRQVAINMGHTTGTTCQGTGVRLIDANSRLIGNWMEWTPTSSLHGGPTPPAGLPKLDDPAQLLSADELGLLRPVGDLVGKLRPARRVLQYIDGTVYDWEEHEIARRSGPPLIAVRLLAPVDKMLEIEEAQILLSASRRWRVELAAAEAEILPRSAVEDRPIARGPMPPARAPRGAAVQRLDRTPDVEIAR